MPLLGKRPFIRIEPPDHLEPNEELFYCKLTHEVFRDYEGYFERVILCNSLVWTCSLTGRSGLTFQEAVDSEAHAHHLLASFPDAVKRPILYLTTLTHRGRLADLCDDVFVFARDRFFVGEEVDISINNSKKRCTVTKVLPPEKDTSLSNKKSDELEKPKLVGLDPHKYKYDVVDNHDTKYCNVPATSVNRIKGSFTRDKSKLFIKRHVQQKDGIWKIKEDAVAKYKINDTSFKDVFAGPPPLFENSPKKKIISSIPLDGRKVVTSKLKDKHSKNVNSAKNEGNYANAVKEKSTVKVKTEQMVVPPEQLHGTLEKIMEQKMRQKMEKEREREKRKEEKKLLAEYKQEWKRPRDDLECDDLRELPPPTPVNCSIPVECFGDAIMVLEFLHRFANLVDLKDSFPKGFTFELLERCLVETDIQGPFSHLLQLLLATIFHLSEEEEREEAEDSMDSSDANDAETDDETDRSSSSETSKSAPCTASLLQLVHGATLKNMPLDCFTLTEILRIHLISSGAQIQWSTNDRRQYFLEKDPALAFKTEEADTLKQLSMVSVYGLSIEDRLKILKVLISQLLTYELFRDAIEETNEKLRQTKVELRQLNISYKREREENASLKKKSDAKAKDDEKKALQSTLVQESGGKLIVNGTNNVQTEDKSESELQKLSPEEEEQLIEKRLKEQLRKKEEYDRKVAELKSQIIELQSASALLPIGRNRCYNRFWIFNSLPGLFVEDDDPFIGTCQQYPTPYNPKSNPSMFQNELPLSFMTKYLQRLSDDKSTNSDKENESVDSLSHKYVNENVQYVRTPKLMINGNEENVILNSNVIPSLNPEVICKLKPTSDLLNANESEKTHIQEEEKLPITGMCTACPLTCPVHGNTVKRTKWAFYYKTEELESLLNTLNSRGFREGSLREALLSVKEKLLEILGKCPTQRLNKELPAPIQPEIRKSQRFLCNQPSQFASMAPENAIEQILRDTILDIEDKIYAGCLGAIKVEDRIAWRTAIEFGVKDTTLDKNENELKEANDMTLQCKDGIKKKGCVSSDPSRRVLKQLASCMLEVAQGIDPKFLKPPLGEDNNLKKQKQKGMPDMSKKAKQQEDGLTEGTSTPPPVKAPKSSFDKWKELLMMSTSLSQLFLYLATLERSVQWSRSGLNARCKICRCSGDAENMLLCDGCNRGHHTYCLKPPLADIPSGDWYCTTCKPKEKPVSPKKNRKYYEEDEESELEMDDNLNDQYESEKNEDVCDACYKGGTLICCDGCPLSFHLECVDPPLRRVPRGVWNCPKCVALATKQAAAAKHSANNSGLYKTRAQLLLSFSDKKRSRTSSPASDNGKSKREYKGHNSYSFSEDNGRTNRNKRRSVDDVSFDYVTCDRIITLLLHHPDSWPFLRPVNKKDVPDYYKIIKKPMDLGTIRSKLNNMQYFSNKAFIADVYLILQNCELYNPRNSVEYKAGQRLQKATENALHTYKLNVCEIKDCRDSVHPPTKSRRTM